MFGICSRSWRRRSHGSSCRKRIAVSNVAPPHISRLKRVRRARAPRRRRPPACRSVRTRVAMQRLVRVAEGRVGDRAAAFASASTRRISSARARAAAGACPAAAAACDRTRRTARLERRRRLVALRVRIAVDDHVAEEVQQLGRAVAPRLELRTAPASCRSASSSPGPRGTSGCVITFSRNGMFVFTPRMRNSRSARSMRLQRRLEASARRR